MAHPAAIQASEAGISVKGLTGSHPENTRENSLPPGF
jgi:hypothetical protein